MNSNICAFISTSSKLMRKEEQYSRHHILPKSMFGSSEPCNIEILKNSTHRALHTLFQNRMIAEQLITTVELSDKALREDVREWLIDTLTSKNIHDPYVWYKDECIR